MATSTKKTKRYEVAGESLDVGGVVKGLRKGKLIPIRVVAKLKKMEAGDVSMFDALVKRKAIKDYEPPKDDDKKEPTPAPVQG